MWLCRRSQQEIRKAKESGSTTKVEVATTIRLVEETSRKELSRIKEDPITKATKEVVLEVEEEVVVESLTRVTFSVTIVKSMVTILVIVQRNERIKKVMQSLQNMKKKR
jgi:hypothetical protein